MKKLSKLYLGIVFFFLYAPILVLIVFSFNQSKSRSVWTLSLIHIFALCAAVYWLGTVINRRFPSVLTTPFLLSIIFLILFLVLFHIPVENFRQGGDLLQLLIGPATTALGLSIYRQREVIMKNLLPVLAGVVVGSAASVLTVLLLCHVMQVPDVLTNSIVGKSTTTPFAVAIAESRGGIGAVAAVAVLFTGLTGTAFAQMCIRDSHTTCPPTLSPPRTNRI